MINYVVLMRGSTDMHSASEKKKLTEMMEIISNILNDQETNLSEITQRKKEYRNDLAEKQALINSLGQTKKKNANLFSPNCKELNIKEYEIQLQNIKEKLNSIEEDEQEQKAKIERLMEIKNTLNIQEPYNLNSGINMLEIQERDRQRIARDLHDSTVQNLTGLIHRIELCLKLVDIDPVRSKLELSTMSNTIKLVINEIREIIYNLKPMSLDDLGLITTVDRYVNQIMMNHDINIHIYHNDERQDILPVINLSLFRIIQEACNNAIKHADAKIIEIKIMYEKNKITLSISDDGKGFDAKLKKDCVAPDRKSVV